MFISKVAPLAAIFISGVWAQFDMAQCNPGFDWVRAYLPSFFFRRRYD
jgi:hypothetical protein